MRRAKSEPRKIRQALSTPPIAKNKDHTQRTSKKLLTPNATHADFVINIYQSETREMISEEPAFVQSQFQILNSITPVVSAAAELRGKHLLIIITKF